MLECLAWQYYISGLSLLAFYSTDKICLHLRICLSVCSFLHTHHITYAQLSLTWTPFVSGSLRQVFITVLEAFLRDFSAGLWAVSSWYESPIKTHLRMHHPSENNWFKIFIVKYRKTLSITILELFLVPCLFSERLTFITFISGST